METLLRFSLQCCSTPLTSLPRTRQVNLRRRIERKFDSLDIAMYDVEADPEERNDLRAELPSVFSDLRERAIRHLANVVEADFPPADFSGHPRNFGGNFSPGWCQPKYL